MAEISRSVWRKWINLKDVTVKVLQMNSNVSVGEACHKAVLGFGDGTQLEVEVNAGETLLAAAERQQVNLPHSCRVGTCGSCVGNCANGSVDMTDNAIGLTQQEKDKGYILPCQLTLNSDAEFNFDFDSELCKPNNQQPFSTQLETIERIGSGAVLISLKADLPCALKFRAGQFIEVQVPGTESWRSYSFVNLPNEANNLQFLMRVLPADAQGVMSEYLENRATVGDSIILREPRGSFYLREVDRPILLLAGGTGLSAIVSMLRQLVADQCQQSVTLFYAVNKVDDLCLVDEIKRLGTSLTDFCFEPVVSKPDGNWSGGVGYVTDLLNEKVVHQGNCDVYLCGPPAMIDGVKRWFDYSGLNSFQLHFEKFAPSGCDATVAVAPVKHLHIACSPSEPKVKRFKHAVVIGGSIAGMLAAKALLEHFDKVTVLERDSHHPMAMETVRPSTGQGQHAHHLLQGGQKVFNRLLPEFVDDFVAAGGKLADSSKNFRFYQNNGWKLVFDSGIKVCVGRRNLLEGVVRRQMDKYPAIEYRYNATVEGLLHDDNRGCVTGVSLKEGLNTYNVDADLVIDASGKNTQVPIFLTELGYQKPIESHMPLNVFYSTVLFRVPEHLRQNDWSLMAIYNRRPVENVLGYAACYGQDNDTMLVTLINFNCNTPPRDMDAFREIARTLPQPHIHNIISESEPITEIHSFKYPSMFRRHYEKLAKLPAGIISIGDAFASADPVSGAGMTKAALEVESLVQVLAEQQGTDEDSVLSELPKQFYRHAAQLNADIWFVLGEQNYRYPWVEGKRPFATGFINWYVDQVLDTAHYDRDAFKRFMQVYHLNSRYTSLFAPKLVLKVLKHTLTKSWRHVYKPAAVGEVREPIVFD
jgi:NAD(P)H-flavin reductase/2-polyprenyl-6-methoxyphenol hydroxylase-like FAD-dependent oxidoreductase/ferredoxin